MKRRSALFALAMIVGVGFIGSATFVVQRASLLQTDSRNKAFELADTDGDGTLSVREIRKAVTQSIMASTSPNAKPMYDFDGSGMVNRQDVKNIVATFKSILETPPAHPASSAKDTTMPLVEYAFIREKISKDTSMFELVILSYNLIGEFNGRYNRAIKVTSGSYEEAIYLEESLAPFMPTAGKSFVFALPDFQPSETDLATLNLIDVHPITHEETVAASMPLRIVKSSDEYASDTLWKPAECQQGSGGTGCSQNGASFAIVDIPQKSMGEQYVATVRVKYDGEFKDYDVPVMFQSTQALTYGIQPIGVYMRDNDCAFTEANMHFVISRYSSLPSAYMISIAFDGIADVVPLSTLHNQEWCMGAYSGMLTIPAANEDSFGIASFEANKLDVAIVSITKRPLQEYVASKGSDNIVLASRVPHVGGNDIEYNDLNVTFPEIQHPEGKRSYVLMDILDHHKQMGFVNGATITDFAAFENLLPSRSAEAGVNVPYARIIITEPLAPDAVGVNGNMVIDNISNEPIISNLLPEQMRYVRTVTFADIMALEPAQ